MKALKESILSSTKTGKNRINKDLAVKLAKKLDNIRKEEERLELINLYENEGYRNGYI